MLDFYRIAMFMYRMSNQCMEDNVTALFASIYYVSNETISTSHFVNIANRTNAKKNTSAFSSDGVVR